MALSRKDLLGQDEFWVFLFLLGWTLLNWPMLTMAGRSIIWGMPIVLLYVALIWLMITVMLYLFERRHSG
ncbi:MAG: hypothetical protein A4E44_01395 [Methanosaeta sp. PtaB.Bin018]|jgi:hypothetical protein|nr:MAG: hypothetical protein A4E44_01395 [Methanosaeta sp. PtaB.Bin018]OPY46652.1 MAG: hypothetical protein A4E46_00822 [Methanosaeta sp. PtaU1.Bin016]